MPENEYFIRNLDLINHHGDEVTLVFHQKIVGDVNCIVWDAAIVFTKYLEKKCRENRNFLVGKNVIELGAGVGCAGLAAATFGANVILTDLTESLDILKINIKENEKVLAGSAKANAFHWGDTHNFTQPDMIILSDCIYYKPSIDGLIRTLQDLSNDDTEIIQVQEIRDSEQQRSIWEYYMNEIEKHFKINEVPLHEQNNEFSSEDIKVFTFKKL